VSTRRVENLSASLGVTGLSKSQVSAMAAELDEMVEGFRSRRLDGGPWCRLSGMDHNVQSEQFCVPGVVQDPPDG
jgi:hypothetical protein